MSYDGSGNFNKLYNFVYDTVISETEMNAQFDDYATGLSTAITKDGQTTISANIPFNNYRITMVANPVDAQDVVNKQYADANYVAGVAGDFLAVANNLSDLGNAGTARTNLGVAIGSDVEAFNADILKADESDTLTVGMLGTSYSLGNINSATTLSIANGNIQHGTMTGSFTLTAPNDTDDGYIELELTIDATGGYTLTLSGFNEVSGAVDMTANVVNVLRISKLNTNTYLEVIQAV